MLSETCCEVHPCKPDDGLLRFAIRGEPCSEGEIFT